MTGQDDLIRVLQQPESRQDAKIFIKLWRYAEIYLRIYNRLTLLLSFIRGGVPQDQIALILLRAFAAWREAKLLRKLGSI